MMMSSNTCNAETAGGMSQHFQKFSFRIKTRDGVVVDRIAISAESQVIAETRLRQIYRHCEVLDVIKEVVTISKAPTNFEDVMDLITR